MARYNPEADLSALYRTMDRLRSDCLNADGSLLDPQRTLWTAEGFNQLDKHFVQNLDEGEGNFFGKLKSQMSSAPPQARQLMSELIWLLYAFQRKEVAIQTKDDKVRIVWSWSGEELPPNVGALTKDVLQGVGRAGMGYNNNKWRELVFLITAIRALKAMPLIDRAAIINGPTEFSSWLETFAPGQNRQLPHILTFLMFPDHFERISTARNKRDILVAYGHASAKDIRAWTRPQLDQGLFDLRKSLEAEHGSRVDFYEGLFGEKWRELKTARQSKTLTAPTIGNDDEYHQIGLTQSGHQSHFELNTIFYGPPGTGKTFYTSHRAVLICNDSADDDRKKLRNSYEALRAANRIAFVTFHQGYTYEDFVEGMRPKANGAGFTLEPEDGILLRMAKAAIANPQQNYVLIIDEINRANVAKVFGELITLLEADKRIRGDDMVTVTLPYSKSEFAMPPNLYLIGTMNTADRSITLLDTALRRRFVFEELASDSSVLENIALDDTATNLSRLLDGLNTRLTYLLGEDAQIGHAWFMSVRTKADLDKVMAFKIIPLLKEYFHDDLDLVYRTLGGEDGFLKREVLPSPKGFNEVRFRYYDPYASDAQYDEDAYLALMA